MDRVIVTNSFDIDTIVSYLSKMFLCSHHPYLWCFEVCKYTSIILLQAPLCSPLCAALLQSAEMSVHFPIISAWQMTRVFLLAVNHCWINQELHILTVYRQGNRFKLYFLSLPTPNQILSPYSFAITLFFKSYSDPCGIIDSLQLTEISKKLLRKYLPRPFPVWVVKKKNHCEQLTKSELRPISNKQKSLCPALSNYL